MNEIKNIWNMGIKTQEIDIRKTQELRNKGKIGNFDIILKNNDLYWLDKHRNWHKTKLYNNTTIKTIEVNNRKDISKQKWEKAKRYSTMSNIITLQKTQLGITSTYSNKDKHSIRMYEVITSNKSDISKTERQIFITEYNNISKKIAVINKKYIHDIIEDYNQIFGLDYPKKDNYTKSEILQILKELWQYTGITRYKSDYDYINEYLLQDFIIRGNADYQRAIDERKFNYSQYEKNRMKSFYMTKIRQLRSKKDKLMQQMKSTNVKAIRSNYRHKIRQLEKKIKYYSTCKKALNLS